MESNGNGRLAGILGIVVLLFAAAGYYGYSQITDLDTRVAALEANSAGVVATANTTKATADAAQANASAAKAAADSAAAAAAQAQALAKQTADTLAAAHAPAAHAHHKK